MQRRWINALAMIALLVAFRVVGNLFPATLPNFQPLCALFLCSIACQRGTIGWAVPLVAWAVSSPLASWLNHANPFDVSSGVLLAFAVFLGIGCAARLLRHRATPAILIGSSLAAGLLFHLITNTAAWAADPGYAKTASGFAQALWTGRPGELPTWVFLRNLLAANVIFTALFLLARRPAAAHEGRALPLVPTSR